MDPFPIKIQTRNMTLPAVVFFAVVGLAANLLLMGLLAFVLAFAAAKGWAAA